MEDIAFAKVMTRANSRRQGFSNVFTLKHAPPTVHCHSHGQKVGDCVYATPRCRQVLGTAAMRQRIKRKPNPMSNTKHHQENSVSKKRYGYSCRLGGERLSEQTFCRGRLRYHMFGNVESLMLAAKEHQSKIASKKDANFSLVVSTKAQIRNVGLRASPNTVSKTHQTLMK